MLSVALSPLVLAASSPLDGEQRRYWSDHYVRVSSADRQHAAKLHAARHARRELDGHAARRELMNFEPINSYEGDWIINGNTVNLNPLDGTPDWVELLDQNPYDGAEAGVPALVCLPFSCTVSDPSTQVEGYVIPGTNRTLVACPEPCA